MAASKKNSDMFDERFEKFHRRKKDKKSRDEKRHERQDRIDNKKSFLKDEY